MSVPEGFNISNLTGVFTMNKTLSDSDSIDEVLRLQGVGWLKRRAISLSTVTLYIKHYKDEEGIEHIDIDQTLTGGIPGTREERTLNWKERKHEDHLFGAVKGKSRRTMTDVLEDGWLKTDWTDDTYGLGVVQSYVESDTPKSGTTWIANQTWGIGVINEERRYVRHLKFLGPNAEDLEVKLVYDYYGTN